MRISPAGSSSADDNLAFNPGRLSAGPSMRTSARLADGGRLGRSVLDAGPLWLLEVADVAVLPCCTHGQRGDRLPATTGGLIGGSRQWKHHRSFAGCPAGVGDVGRVVDIAGEDEEQIGKPVQVRGDLGADVFGTA